MCSKFDHLPSRGESPELVRIRMTLTTPQVIRTRLRQPLENGKVKYTGLVQTLRLVIAEEGAKSLYGGLSAHLMRVIPNAAVMFFIYEAVIRSSW